MISIITASYNYETLIGRAIESIIAQTYDDWELIIVDDGSKDNSIEVIKKYAENSEKIHLFQHENGINKGLKETVKLGIEKANGDFIAFLESDDFWENNYLEEKIKIIKNNPEAKFIFNDVQLFGEETAINSVQGHFRDVKKIIDKKPWPRNISGHFIMINLVSTFSCAMVEKQTLQKCDFNPPIDAILDVWLWMQIAQHNKFYYIDKKLTHWMQHSSSYLKTSNDVAQAQKQKIFFNALIDLLFKNSTSSVDKLKLILYKIFVIPEINKIFRGTIRKLLLIME